MEYNILQERATYDVVQNNRQNIRQRLTYGQGFQHVDRLK